MDEKVFDAYERLRVLLGRGFLYETEGYTLQYKNGFYHYVILLNDNETVLKNSEEEIRVLCEVIAGEMRLEVVFLGPEDERGYYVLYIKFYHDI